MKAAFFLSSLVTGLATVGSFFTLLSLPTQAQQLPPLPIEFDPDDLTNPGRPGGRRRGGGSRGGCRADIPLTAIAYADSQTATELGVTRVDETVGGLTTQAQPLLWFYLPEPLDGGSAPELVLQNSQEQVVYQGQVAGETSQSGIIGVPLSVSLEPDEAYRWSLTINCDESERTTVSGWLERRSLNEDLSRTLRQANARNRAALYANYGFLQDSLSELAGLRLADPDDEAIAQAWANLLSLLDLPELTEVALLDCCQTAAIGDRSETEASSSSETLTEEETEDAESEHTEEEDVGEEAEDTTADEEQVEQIEDTRTILQRARDRG